MNVSTSTKRATILTDRICEQRVAKRVKITTANVRAFTPASSRQALRPSSSSSPTLPPASNARNGWSDRQSPL
jgi:hypothetical protein